MNTSSLSMYSFGEPWREFWPHVLMGAKFTPHLPFLPSVALVKTGLLRASGASSGAGGESSLSFYERERRSVQPQDVGCAPAKWIPQN